MRTRSHPHWQPWLCAAVLLLVRVPAGAQEASEPAAAASAPAPAASGNTLGSALGSLFGRIKAAVSDDKPASAPDATKAPEGMAGKNASTNTPADASKPGGFSIIDIESWSRTSDVVLDPQCKAMVQPFGLSDNAASLAVLATKLKLNNVVGQLQGNAAKPMDVKDVLKLAARHLNWLPMEAELALGQYMLGDTELLEEGKNKDTQRVYAEARATLAEIVQFLPTPLPYDFQVRVLTKNGGNAMALPGGIILVDRDLFKKGANHDFAHFVMAHEVAHVLQRHQTRVYQARLADGVDTVEGLRKLMSSASNKNVGTLLASGTALKKLFVNFTEQQELQSDSCAVRLMSQRYPNSKLLDLKLKNVERELGPVTPDAVIAAEGPQGNTVIDHIKYLADGVLERHPHTLQRRRNLQTTFNVTLTTSTTPTGSAPPTTTR